MGLIQHHVIVATVDLEETAEKIRKFIKNQAPQDQELFTENTSRSNGYITFVLNPDGSKEHWLRSDEGDEFRALFRILLKALKVVHWVEITYGETGTRIITQGDEE